MRCESCASWTNEAICKDRPGADPNYPCIHYHPVPSAAADLNKCGNRGKDSERVPVPLSGKEESEGKTSKVGEPSRGGSLSIQFSRVWAMPSSDTFSVKPIGEFVQRYLKDSKVSVDPFARNNQWATWTNDLNPNTSAQYHMDAALFLTMLKGEGVHPDLVIFDPPYSPRQVKEVYEQCGKHFGIEDQWNTGRWTKERDLISQLEPNVVLSFGWNTQGLGKKNGFVPAEILLVCHGGAHNDTICMAEKRFQGRLI